MVLPWTKLEDFNFKWKPFAASSWYPFLYCRRWISRRRGNDRRRGNVHTRGSTVPEPARSELPRWSPFWPHVVLEQQGPKGIAFSTPVITEVILSVLDFSFIFIFVLYFSSFLIKVWVIEHFIFWRHV